MKTALSDYNQHKTSTISRHSNVVIKCMVISGKFYKGFMFRSCLEIKQPFEENTIVMKIGTKNSYQTYGTRVPVKHIMYKYDADYKTLIL